MRDGGELAERLAHEARLQADVAVAHLALDLGLGDQRRHRVDDDHVHRTRAHQRVGDLERLLAVIRLRDQELVDVDAELARVADVERVLGVDEGRDAAGALDIIVIDSVAALVPRAEIEGEMGDSHVGLQARLMSQALRKLTGSISRSRCMVIFINQVRMKIGVMYGNPETTTGGNALKFYASVRLDIRRTGQIKDRDDIVGNTTRVKVVKNKVAPPFKQVEFDIMYGQGISKIGEILDLGVKAGLVEKSGSWFSYDSIRIGQGRENAKIYLTENPEMAERIERSIRGKTEEVGEALMVGPTADDDIAAE